MAETLRQNGFLFPSELKGWLSLNEGARLYQLAQRNKQLGVVVELGSYHGKSTICLAQGVQNIRDGKVYAVDLFEGNRYVNYGDFLPVFEENVASYGVKDSIIPVKGDFSDVAKEWTQPIRLLFIDGAHQYEDVKTDFDAWEKHVAVGGVIAFHDSLSHPGVTRFITEAMQTGKFSQWETLDSKSGLTYTVKNNAGKIISDSEIFTSIDKLKALARKKILSRFTTKLIQKTPFGNRRFK